MHQGQIYNRLLISLSLYNFTTIWLHPLSLPQVSFHPPLSPHHRYSQPPSLSSEAVECDNGVCVLCCQTPLLHYIATVRREQRHCDPMSWGQSNRDSGGEVRITPSMAIYPGWLTQCGLVLSSQALNLVVAGLTGDCCCMFSSYPPWEIR